MERINEIAETGISQNTRPNGKSKSGEMVSSSSQG